ncbi:MAG: cation:proton antiporter, partial [Armatimonadota bacterium]
METHQITSTILQIVLILSFAKVLGEVAERLGQPSVLGELVAGVLLGASVLGWIKTSDSITLLAELGV